VKARKIAFWLTVGTVAIGANFALELGKRYIPSQGFADFVNFVHCGPGKAA
jgi:hypothetical protein